MSSSERRRNASHSPDRSTMIDDKRLKRMTKVTIEEFNRRGGEIIKRIPGFGSQKAFYDDWINHFGVSPIVVFQVWALIKLSWPDDEPTKSARSEHLLWALMLLKTAADMPFLTKSAGCDAKTFRKWAWLFVDRIALLEDQVVRPLSLL